jgi:acyl-CoA synthetase (AMP-forming)/AMP-acid ligase II
MSISLLSTSGTSIWSVLAISLMIIVCIPPNLIEIVKLTFCTAILIDGDTNRSYTFAQIRDLSAAFGRGLRHTFDWQKGDVLAFFAPNHIDTAVVNLGVLWAGGVASPANPTYTAEELASQLVDARAQALVTHKAFLQKACKAAELASLKPERIILLGDGKDDAGRFRHWTEVTDKGAWFKPKKPTIDPQKDLAYLSYSSVREYSVDSEKILMT